MQAEDVKNVCILGAGFIAPGVAQVFASKGFNVVIYSKRTGELAPAIHTIRSNLNTIAKKGIYNENEIEPTVKRIRTSGDLAEAVKGSQLIIECLSENMELKQKYFHELDELCLPETILASNTSNLNITEIAHATKYQNRVIGMHFFIPVHTSKLVEVVKGTLTSAEVLATTVAIVKQLGKESIVCPDFSYGFLVNRPYTAMVLEAVQMVWERVAPPEEIDKALCLAFEMPIGPLKLCDKAGIWNILAASEGDKIKELGSEKGCLHPLIRMMVRAGYIGGKDKKGIYDFYQEKMKPEKF